MSDSAGKVRLVRCPKCENVLPELADYSLYQCGGCGAVLRGNKGNVDADTFSDKSGEEGEGGFYAKPCDVSERENSGRSDTLIKKGITASSETSEMYVGSSPKVERKEVLSNHNGGRLISPEKQPEVPKFTGDIGDAENDLDMNQVRDKLGGFKESKPQMGYTSKSVRSRGTPSWRNGERSVMDDFQRNPRKDFEGLRISASNYPEERSGMDGFRGNSRKDVEEVRISGSNYAEGPSNYFPPSTYGGYGEAFKYDHNDTDGPKRVAYLEQDRAELLRKLDELKDQLSRSSNVADRPQEKVPLEKDMRHHESYGHSDAWFSDGSSTSNRASKQIFMPGNHVAGPPYYAHYPEPYPYARHEMAMHNSYPSAQIRDEMPRYGEYFGSHLPRRAPIQPPNQYQQQTPHSPYVRGLYVDADPDAFEPYALNALQHHPSCSCYHCFKRNRQVAPPIQPNNSDNPRFGDVPNNPMFYHLDNPNAMGPRLYNSRPSNPPPLSSHDPRPHTRWPSDLNSEMDGVLRRPLQRVVLANGGRRCRPVAGGAPFITCHTCFELLQLPKKALIMEKSQQKIRCGACSTVIHFTVGDKKLLVSADAEISTTPKEKDDGSNEVGIGRALHSHPPVNRASSNFYSDDFDSSGYEFQSMDRGTVLSTADVKVDSNKSRDGQSFQSSSPTDSEDEDFQGGLAAQREMKNSVDTPKKSILTRPPAGSPLQEHFDFSSNNHAANRFAKGNQSSRSDHEKVMPKIVPSRQNSLKEASMATEMEVSFNEYSNTGTSQDSMDASREEDRRKINRGGVFAGIIKKSFRDFGRSNQAVENEKAKVTINEHPIPDRLIKKAEKLAGPIHPGQYWYDSRAGFWGVLGGPCRGIIPPFIEEFDFPMPENCSGGTTSVFVNGRELHQKDLDLLASRGLPTVRDRSYIIEISGRVLDEDTGEELDSLGRLAPTVEKAKHGFGMKAPRSAAA